MSKSGTRVFRETKRFAFINRNIQSIVMNSANKKVLLPLAPIFARLGVSFPHATGVSARVDISSVEIFAIPRRRAFGWK